MDNQINIQKEFILNAYKNGNQDQKALLENLFGKDIFQPKEDNRPVTERIKTFQDACNALGCANRAVLDYFAISETGCSKDILAFAKLRVIVAAINEGWEPTFYEDEFRYYPSFCIYSKDAWDELDEDEKNKLGFTLRANGNANANGGLVFANAFYAGSHSYSYYGVRLAFKTRELAEYCCKQFLDIWADFLFA